jgi:hypothetical protein
MRDAMEDKWMLHSGMLLIMESLLTPNIHTQEEIKNVHTNQKWKPLETKIVHKFPPTRLLLWCQQLQNNQLLLQFKPIQSLSNFIDQEFSVENVEQTLTTELSWLDMEHKTEKTFGNAKTLGEDHGVWTATFWFKRLMQTDQGNAESW